MCKREMRRTKVLSTWIKPIVGSMVVCAGASALHAATSPVTFAQAIEASTANVFAYNDNGVGKDAELGTSTGGALGAAVPINFTYLSGAGIPLSDTDLTGVQNATISLTSSSTKAVVTGFGGTIAQQAIDNSGSLTDVIKITRTTPASEGGGSKTNLLTVTFTGHLQGPVNGTTPSLSAATTAGDTVTYSSDFLSFAQATQEDFNVAFSSWAPLITPPTGLNVDSSDGYYNSATAAGAATFDFQGATSVIPEPASLPILLGGVVMAFACGRNLRRRGNHASSAL